jgi:hypothetical protein
MRQPNPQSCQISTESFSHYKLNLVIYPIVSSLKWTVQSFESTNASAMRWINLVVKVNPHHMKRRRNCYAIIDDYHFQCAGAIAVSFCLIQSAGAIFAHTVMIADEMTTPQIIE